VKWIVILALLILVSCGPAGERSGAQVLSGSDGVVLSVIHSPRQVFEGEHFSIAFELENKGLADVDAGLLSLSFDSLYLRHDATVPDANQFSLRGRDRYRQGDKGFMTVYFSANELQRASRMAETAVMMSACYPYYSTITQNVCIERDAFVESGAVACRNIPLRPPTPGAPVGVSSIQANSVRTSVGVLAGGQEEFVVLPSFRLTLRNYGGGLPTVGDCGSEDAIINAVRVHAYLLDAPLDCGDGLVRFTRQEAQVLCRLPAEHAILREGGNYVSLLNVELEYTYRDSERVEVRIVRP
jgi:hypothetical protein